MTVTGEALGGQKGELRRCQRKKEKKKIKGGVGKSLAFLMPRIPRWLKLSPLCTLGSTIAFINWKTWPTLLAQHQKKKALFTFQRFGNKLKHAFCFPKRDFH